MSNGNGRETKQAAPGLTIAMPPEAWEGAFAGEAISALEPDLDSVPAKLHGCCGSWLPRDVLDSWALAYAEALDRDLSGAHTQEGLARHVGFDANGSEVSDWPRLTDPEVA